MRRLSKTMAGLLLGATLMVPAAAEAQDRGHDRGGWQHGGGGGENAGQRGGGDAGGQRGGWQRGGGDQGGGGGWQRGGGDRGAMMNGDARREAMQQAREANRQVERPTPVMQPQVAPTPRPDRGDQGRRGWQGGDRGGWQGGDHGGWNRGDRGNRDNQRGQDVAANPDRRRGGGEGWQGHDNNHGDWNRDRNGGNHDVNRNWATERRDGNRSWTTNRRDWDRGDHQAWNRQWRDDHRYNWQSYRNQHRNIYRLPRYEARFGYSYHRWYPGYRFDPWFYSSSFWISDPFYYRLPPAYGPYRWVRYYDDAVLVDTETGEIADIIYSFFY